MTATTSAQRAVLRLRRDARLAEDPDRSGAWRIDYPNGFVRLGALPTALAASVRMLAEAPVTESSLVDEVGEDNLLHLRMFLRKLDSGGLLEHGYTTGGELLATLRPLGVGKLVRSPAPDPEVPRKLSRFVTIRPQDGKLIAQAPSSHLALEVSEPMAGVLGALAGWATRAELGERLPRFESETVDAVLDMARDAGLLISGGPESDPETGTMALRQWSVPDLWQHARSRGQRLSPGYGGTYPLVDDFSPLPFVPPASGGRRVALPTPDLDAISATDPSLTETIERRRSIREHDDTAPLSAAGLGELLYRCVRTKDQLTVEDDELGSRPYPAGGALHELEFYPLITACEGVEPGLWHYATADHALERVDGDDAAVSSLVETARLSGLMSSPPQVVVVITARFGRVMRKYEGMSYALILKHVGVVYQTMYLVATSMGLAPCALGGGDAETFARASGLDYATEGSVGEFVLGSAAPRS
ncbi:SagB-type dehydrogenase family enzyme [Saccharopolyspora lacisalsi]|uniref:SagB-type dehydrogenase family enzyme n=1 Tax=Halosaccharopolyspora lacisalsi TaxID=1000566 RepID=A0A839E3Q9_9PSEU|nr:SagB family peptide dehydrogenase [Halosaccharopolyspora lacisalsi]MBA8827499.1 SagB-type dehydrogenase family enzyme [Halosaccharopolyspora lacisalsi]